MFSQIRNDIGSNFKDIRFMEKVVQLSTLHILDKFSYFPKHYNFHEIMLYSQYPSENILTR